MRKVQVGQYLVIGDDGDWQVMEQFGDYRISRKRFATLEAATRRAQSLDAKRVAP